MNGRLAAGLLVSVAVHAGCIVAARLPQAAGPAAVQPGAARLTLRLRPPPLPSTPTAPSAPRRAAAARPRPAPPAPRRAPENPAMAPAAVSDNLAPAPSPAPSPARPAAQDATALMAAARHDAAQFARELNAEANKENKRNGGTGYALRNTRQALLDRRFEEAFQAARSWNGSLPMEEVTRASDGNTRVYVLSTPLGKVCMTTSLDTNPRLGDNPGQSTSYGLCTR